MGRGGLPGLRFTGEGRGRLRVGRFAGMAINPCGLCAGTTTVSRNLDC